MAIINHPFAIDSSNQSKNNLSAKQLQTHIAEAREALANTNTDEKIKNNSIGTRRRVSGVLEIPNIEEQADQLIKKVVKGLQAMVLSKSDKSETAQQWIDSISFHGDKTYIFKVVETLRDILSE